MNATGPGSILCPDCRKLINADEKRCPYCNARNPDSFGQARNLTGLFGERIDVVRAIPIVCVVAYVLSLALNPRAALSGAAGFLSILSPSQDALFVLGMTLDLPGFRTPWWTLINAMYLHGSLLHIFFNMMWIRSLGPEVESAFGSARFFVIFTVSGIAGFALSNGVPVDWGGGRPTIGASGAVFGLLAALIVFGRAKGGYLGELVRRQLWQWAIVLFAFGFLLPGINNWAHLGGFGGGWILAWLYTRGGVRPERRSDILIALLCLAATVFGFLMAGIRVTRLFLS